MNVSASKSQVEENSIEAMNKLVERIKSANGELAEVGDIGSETANSNLTKQLQKDLSQFQAAFCDNLEELRKREDMILQILEAQEIALKRGLYGAAPGESNSRSQDHLFQDLNQVLSPDRRLSKDVLVNQNH